MASQEFLPNASVIIQGVAGDVRKGSDCVGARRRRALNLGESITYTISDTLTPRVIGWEASRGFEDLLERPWTMSKSRRGHGRGWASMFKMTVTYLSP